MKKIIVIFVVLLITTGCFKKISAKDVVSNYLNNYVNLSKDVQISLNKVLDENKEFNNDNKNMYKKVMQRQYKDLKYVILTEEYDNDKALITVNLNVYDLIKAEESASNYLSSHLSEFYDDNDIFDNTKYINYKLDLMSKSVDRVDYTIVFFLYMKNGKWVLEQPTDEDLEKIHGIYKQ